MEKLWLRCETISDGKAMENRGTMMKKWSKTMEKQWKIAALMRDENDAK